MILGGGRYFDGKQCSEFRGIDGADEENVVVLFKSYLYIVSVVNIRIPFIIINYFKTFCMEKFKWHLNPCKDCILFNI